MGLRVSVGLIHGVDSRVLKCFGLKAALCVGLYSAGFYMVLCLWVSA